MSCIRAFTVAIAALGVTALPLVAAPPAAAQSGEGVIEFKLDSPPSIADALDARLLLDGDDVTDTYCNALSMSGDDQRPTRTCDGLPAGVYAATLTGVVDPQQATSDCFGPVAAATGFDVIPIQSAIPDSTLFVDVSEWSCIATVSPPGVRLDDGPGSANQTELLAVDLLDSNGDVVTGCEDDDRLDFDRRWCTPLADGDYRAVPLAVPDGLRGTSLCRNGVNPTDSPAVTIDERQVFWTCSAGYSFVPLRISLTWVAWQGLDDAWFTDPGLTLTDDAGADLAAQCVELDRGQLELGIDLRIRYDCSGIEPGTYDLDFTEIPAGFDRRVICDPIVVPEDPGTSPESCGLEVNSEALQTAPTTTQPTPTTLLPATGSSSSSLQLLALALLVGGVALVVASRRRTTH